jgi:gluconokinase
MVALLVGRKARDRFLNPGGESVAEKYFLGIDPGTGSCKACVLDRAGRVLGFGQGAYAAGDDRLHWNEQDPRGVMAGMAAASRQALEAAQAKAGEVSAVSLGGAMHSLLALDSAGEPLTGVITWADGRGAKQAAAQRGTPQAEQRYRRTGCPAHGMYPLYKILWMREEAPELFARAARFATAKDYVLAQLCGEWLLDYSLGAGHGLMDTRALAWDGEALALAGLRPGQLPVLAGPGQALRLRSPALAAEMGLLDGTPLILGCSDAVNSSLGAGAVLAGQATLMVGTSGALRLIAPQPVLHPAGRSWCYAIDPAHWLVGGAINNGGVALSWLRDLFNQAANAQLSFDDILALAGQAPAGAGGLVCLPFFAGERSPNWNLNARGAFVGLTLQHGAAHMARALLEGIALRFRSLAEMLAEAGCELSEVRASGGFVQSPLWLQITASALKRELRLPASGETSCWGAAAWALIGAGALGSLEEAGALVALEGSVQPDAGQAEVYERLYPIYARLYANLLPSFEEIAGFQEDHPV